MAGDILKLRVVYDLVLFFHTRLSIVHDLKYKIRVHDFRKKLLKRTVKYCDKREFVLLSCLYRGIQTSSTHGYFVPSGHVGGSPIPSNSIHTLEQTSGENRKPWETKGRE